MLEYAYVAGRSAPRWEGVVAEPGEFVDLLDLDADIIVDIRYAGVRHPFGVPLYSLNRAFLRHETALRVVGAQDLVRPFGLRLKIWDAYRPLSVQAVMWSKVPDPTFIAPPTRGSHHNRGVAVDVTLADANGADVEMPTDFDDFTPAAHSDSACSTAATRHRDILRNAMIEVDFTGIDSEWWHFVDPEWRRYGLCDVSIDELAAQIDAQRRG